MTARRSLSVRSKLLIAFVLVALTSIATVSWIGYITTRDSLRGNAERQLQGLQRSKAAIVKTMMTATRNEVLLLSAAQMVAGASKELLAAYRELDGSRVTPDMQAAVRRFYRDEFEPALARRSAVVQVPDALLPVTTTGWYLHYHYLARAERPYGPNRVLASATDGSRFAQTVARLRPLLGPAIDRLGFENVTLVDPLTLDVFYSYLQSSVVGTSLADGPYASSSIARLAQALRHSMDQDDYRMADFEAHRAALGIPKAFIGTPVFAGPKMVAIMILRFPIEPIEEALSGQRNWEAEGLGKSGEAYLLGPDSTMRTDSRFLVEDAKAFIGGLRNSRLTTRDIETIERLGTTILTMPVKHDAARAALNGQSGIMTVDDYRGVPVLMAYGPVDLDSLRWGVIVKIDEREAMAPLRAYAQRVLATAVGLSLLASLVALVLASVLTRPIAALVRGAKEVSQGKLDVVVEVAPDDEYRELGEAFNDMVRSVRESRGALDTQVQENERLLLSLLPASAAAHMRDGSSDARQSFADVTVAYVHLGGFEALSRDRGESQSMELLSEIVAVFDEAADHFGVEKVRTIGSSYLAASGLSVERPDHTARMVEFAREVVRIVRRFNIDRRVTLVAEVGINCGPVIGGLVGRRKFIYELWGDTVRLAKDIAAGKTSIIVTRPVYDRVRDVVPFEPGSRAEVRGAGSVEVYRMTAEAVA